MIENIGNDTVRYLEVFKVSIKKRHRSIDNQQLLSSFVLSSFLRSSGANLSRCQSLYLASSYSSSGHQSSVSNFVVLSIVDRTYLTFSSTIASFFPLTVLDSLTMTSKSWIDSRTRRTKSSRVTETRTRSVDFLLDLSLSTKFLCIRISVGHESMIRFRWSQWIIAKNPLSLSLYDIVAYWDGSNRKVESHRNIRLHFYERRDISISKKISISTPSVSEEPRESSEAEMRCLLHNPPVPCWWWIVVKVDLWLDFSSHHFGPTWFLSVVRCVLDELGGEEGRQYECCTCE